MGAPIIPPSAPFSLTSALVLPTGTLTPQKVPDLFGELPIDICRYGFNGTGGPNYAFTNAAIFASAVDEALSSGRPLAITKPGTYYISYVSKTITRSIEIRVADGVVIKGLGTKSEFTSDGTTTSYTVTDPWSAMMSAGVNVQTYDTNAKVYGYLTLNVDYTVSGTTVTLNTPPAAGLLVRITSTTDTIAFLCGGNIPGAYGVKWIGGTFDNSLRGLAYNQPSGDCLSLSNGRYFHVERVTFKGKGNYTDANTQGFSDSGLGGSFLRGEFIGCNFEGFGDCGIYLTGRNETSSYFKYGDVVVVACHFAQCGVGCALKRRMDQVIIAHCTFEECLSGACLWPAGGNGGGSTGMICGNTFTRCLSPVDCRNIRGISVASNVIIDWGFDVNTGVETPNAPAIKLLAIADSSCDGNVMVLRDFTKSTQVGYFLHSYTFDTTSTVINTTGVVITGGKVCDAAVAFSLDSLATGCSIEGVSLTNVTTIITDSSLSCLWTVNNAGVKLSGKGNTPYTGSWTPSVLLAGNSGLTFTVNNAVGTYQRNGDEVTLHFNVQLNSFTFNSNGAELRLTGLPFTSTSVALTSHGVLGINVGINWPAATKIGTISWEVAASSAQARLRLVGGGLDRTVLDTDITSPSTVRLSGTITYKAA